MSADRYQRAFDTQPGVRIAHPRRGVSMPRQARPLYIGNAGFWPRPGMGWACLALALFDLGLIVFLIVSMVRR